MINLADVAQALRLHRALAQQPSYRGDVRLMPQPAQPPPNGAAASAQMMNLVSGTPTAPAFGAKPVTSHDMVASTAAVSQPNMSNPLPGETPTGLTVPGGVEPNILPGNYGAGPAHNDNTSYPSYDPSPTPYSYGTITASGGDPSPNYGTAGSGNTANLLPSDIGPNPFGGGSTVGDIPAYGVVGGSTNAAGNSEPIYQGGQPGTIDHILYGHGGSVGDQVGNALLKAAPFVTPYGVIARPLLKLINGDFGHLGGLGDIGHYLEHNARTYNPNLPASPSNVPPASSRTNPYVSFAGGGGADYHYPGATAIPLNSSMAQYMNGIGPGGRQVASGGLTGISGGAGGVNNDEIMQAMLMRGTNE